MTRHFATLGPRALAASLLLSAALVGTARAQTLPVLVAELSGPSEGGGVASVTPGPEASTVCYSVTVKLDPPASAAHIHRGEAGVNGPIVVPFEAPTSGSANGCVEGVDAGLIQEIMANPAGFYVNVHNSAFPAGAIRGQLVAQ